MWQLALACALLAQACDLPGRDEDEDERAAGGHVRVQKDGSLVLSADEQRALGLMTTTVAEAELGEVSLRFGRLRTRAGDQALVIAPVEGRIAGPPAVALGESVQAGAKIAELVPVLAAGERLAANVRGAELTGQIEGLEREQSSKQLELARAEQLAASSIVSAAKLQELRAALGATRAQLDALRNARGIQTRQQVAAIALRAELGGTIASLDVESGAIVAAGAIVARIVKPGPRFVDVAVAPDEPVGDRYAVEIAGQWSQARLVARAALVADDGFRHDRLELEQTAAFDLPAGASVQVRVGRGTALGPSVPESALVPGQKQLSVFVERAPGQFVARPVQVAARHDGLARIESGLQSGERVVAAGAQALRGESVRALLQEGD